MAYGDYYNPANKVVNSGDIVYADDINSINTAVDAGFAQVATDLDVLAIGSAAISQAWAAANQGTRPDILINNYSSKANALEAKDWSSATGTITEASTGLPLVGSKSAKTFAGEASASASSASGSASAATTQAGISTTQAGLSDTARVLSVAAKDTATAQAGIATTKAIEAQDWASKAVDVIVSSGKYSSLHYAQKALDAVASLGASVSSIAALTPASDKVPYYTGASTAALATFTAAGRAVVGGLDASAQRVSLALGNVPNIDCTNGSNISSGTVADARIASTISRDNTVGTAVQTALNLKAPLSSPTFTGTPSLTNNPAVSDNTTKLASTAWVIGQRGTGTPAVDGTASAGVSYLYSREDHIHPIDTSRAPINNPTFTGTVTLPNTTYAVSISGSSSSCTGNAATATVSASMTGFLGVVQYNNTATIQPGDIRKLVVLGGAGFTATLPLASSVPQYSRLCIWGQGGARTIVRQGSDTLWTGGVPGASVTFVSTIAMEFVTYDSSTWVLVSGIPDGATLGCNITGSALTADTCNRALAANTADYATYAGGAPYTYVNVGGVGSYTWAVSFHHPNATYGGSWEICGSEMLSEGTFSLYHRYA